MVRDEMGNIIGYALVAAFVTSVVGLALLQSIQDGKLETLMLRDKIVIINQRKAIDFDLSNRRLPP